MSKPWALKLFVSHTFAATAEEAASMAMMKRRVDLKREAMAGDGEGGRGREFETQGSDGIESIYR